MPVVVVDFNLTDDAPSESDEAGGAKLLKKPLVAGFFFSFFSFFFFREPLGIVETAVPGLLAVAVGPREAALLAARALKIQSQVIGCSSIIKYY